MADSCKRGLKMHLLQITLSDVAAKIATRKHTWRLPSRAILLAAQGINMETFTTTKLPRDCRQRNRLSMLPPSRSCSVSAEVAESAS